MKDKIYKIKTIKDIHKIVTEKNIDNFIIDLKSFLIYRMNMKKLKIFENIFKVEFDEDTFTWEDDGKHKGKITIKIKNE